MYYTTYKEAVNWLHNDFILCNKIAEIDTSVFDNMLFDYYETIEEDDGTTYEQENEIFQWFITDASQGDVEYLSKYFDLKFTYSDLLECYILCVDHWGTSWDYVSCPVYELGEYSPKPKTYKELTGMEA